MLRRMTMIIALALGVFAVDLDWTGKTNGDLGHASEILDIALGDMVMVADAQSLGLQFVLDPLADRVQRRMFDNLVE